MRNSVSVAEIDRGERRETRVGVDTSRTASRAMQVYDDVFSGVEGWRGAGGLRIFFQKILAVVECKGVRKLDA